MQIFFVIEKLGPPKCRYTVYYTKFISISGGSIWNNGYWEPLKSVTVGRMTVMGSLEWSKGPDLLINRHGHRSIAVQNQIYHIGQYIGSDASIVSGLEDQ